MSKQNVSTKGRVFAIAPRVVPPGTEVYMSGGVYPADDQIHKRKKLREICRDLLTQVYGIRGTNRAVITNILCATLKGDDVYKDTVLEFFQLYGKFQQKNRIVDTDPQSVEHSKMTAILQKTGDSASCRTYRRPGQPNDNKCPLPLYVRNILAHGGTNTLNKLADEDLLAAINLLKKWTSP